MRIIPIALPADISNYYGCEMSNPLGIDDKHVYRGAPAGAPPWYGGNILGSYWYGCSSRVAISCTECGVLSSSSKVDLYTCPVCGAAMPPPKPGREYFTCKCGTQLITCMKSIDGVISQVVTGISLKESNDDDYI